jgi:hypothetical protein
MPRRKDRLERLIREIVCSGQLDTAMAQEAFAKDWIAAYQRYYQKTVSLPAHTLCDSVSHKRWASFRGSGQSLRQPSSIRSQGMIVLDTSVRQSSRPFRVAVPQATIYRILNRVREAQFPDRLDGNDWRCGTDWDYMKALADYWANEYDWRKAETNLNRYPQFVARVNDYDIHFYQFKGRGPKPMPLVLTQGGRDRCSNF